MWGITFWILKYMQNNSYIKGWLNVHIFFIFLWVALMGLLVVGFACVFVCNSTSGSMYLISCIDMRDRSVQRITCLSSNFVFFTTFWHLRDTHGKSVTLFYNIFIVIFIYLFPFLIPFSQIPFEIFEPNY